MKSARVTSWRSNTDSACFLSSTIPSASFWPRQLVWWDSLTEVSESSFFEPARAAFVNAPPHLACCGLAPSLCPSGCHPGSPWINRSASKHSCIPPSSTTPEQSPKYRFFFQHSSLRHLGRNCGIYFPEQQKFRFSASHRAGLRGTPKRWRQIPSHHGNGIYDLLKESSVSTALQIANGKGIQFFHNSYKYFITCGKLGYLYIF